MGLEIPFSLVSPVSDYELVVEQLVKGSQFRLRFRLSSRAGVQTHQTFPDVVLAENPLTYFRTLFPQVERLKKEDQAISEERLGGIGLSLARQLLPQALRDRLWTIRSEPDYRRLPPTLHLISNETSIPWELLRIGPPGGKPSRQSLFLVEAFALSRWITDFDFCLKLPLQNIAVVAPEDSGLASVPAERDGLLALAGKDRRVSTIPAKTTLLIDALESGSYDGWHYAGHGFVPGTIPDLWSLRLEADEYLQVTDLAGRSAGLGAASPLVCLNTCRSGLGAFSLTEVGGWANGFIAAGAGGFIGTHWAISDSPAAEFAKEFYRQFLTGRPIGGVVHDVRMHLKKKFPGDPTWLAYTVFAHPFASCEAHSSNTSLEGIFVTKDTSNGEQAPQQVVEAAHVEPQAVLPAPEPLPLTNGPTGDEFDVFLSYNSGDRARVEPIARKLQQHGIRVWLDIWNVRPGTIWKRELQKAMRKAPSAIVFVGNGMGPWHEKETNVLLSKAAVREIPIIPALLPGSADRPELPEFLTEYQWVELRGGTHEQEDLEKLIWGIRDVAGKGAAEAPIDGGEPVSAPDDPPTKRPRKHSSKLLISILTLALVIAAGFEIATKTSKEAVKPQPVAVQKRTSAAVLTFLNESGNKELDWLREALPEVLSYKLGIGNSLRVVNRQHVVLSEINLGFDRKPQTTLARDDLKRLQGLLSADYLICGTFGTPGESTIDLKLKVLDLRDGTEVLIAQETRELGSWVELIDRASGSLPDSQPNFRRFFNAAPLSSIEAVRLKAAFPKSLEAARTYAQGIANSYRFNSPAAATLLKRAAELEPNARILVALARQQYFLGQRDLAKKNLAQAQHDTFKFEPYESKEMALLSARLEGDAEAIFTSSQALFVELFPDDLNRGIDYAGIIADLGGFEQVLLVVDDLTRLPGAENHPQISLLKSRAQDGLNNYPAAAIAATEALERAHSLRAMHEEALAEMALGIVAAKTFEPSSALTNFGEAQVLFRNLGDKTNEGRCLELSVRVARKDNLRLAEDLVRQAISIYQERQSQRDLARSLHILSGLMKSQGKLEEGEAAEARSKQALEGLWYSDRDGDDLQSSGYYLHLAGRISEARYEYLAAAAIYSRAGEDDFYGQMLTNLGELELVQAKFKQADGYFQQALSKHLPGPNPVGHAYDLLQTGRLFAASGDYVLAEDRYQDALALLQATAEDQVVAETEIASAELKLALGEFANCNMLADRAEQRLRGSSEKDLWANAKALQIRGLIGLGRVKEASESAATLKNLALHDFRSQYAVSLAIAEAEAARGEGMAAIAVLAPLAKEAAAANHVLFEFEILLALGNLHLKQGNFDTGRELLLQLVTRAKGLGAKQFERRAEALLQSTGTKISSVSPWNTSRQVPRSVFPRSVLPFAFARQSSSIHSGASSNSTMLVA